MWKKISYWLQRPYKKLVNSIAFYPAFIGGLFLLLSYILIELDFSETGKNIKSELSWLTLQDASTARSIISSITAGIISLTVFSFSMVMIVLNQAASQMSNRILDKLIGNRFQQMVLGIYIGTIVYGLFLLSTIRDLDSGISVPALSTYLLILLTVFDIFLFIYFLHYITQSVKYEVIINKVYKDTLDSLKLKCNLTEEPIISSRPEQKYVLLSRATGIYEGFNTSYLLAKAEQLSVSIIIVPEPGSFILENQPIITLTEAVSEKEEKEILGAVYLHSSESIEGNYAYGFRQLSEIAIRALSPGINDPGTAILSLRAIFKLFLYRLQHHPHPNCMLHDQVRIYTTAISFEKLFTDTLLPIWQYGSSDIMIRKELTNLIQQLSMISQNTVFTWLLEKIEKATAEDV